ncbi:MAG TPA: lysophospholipid acyltransferase family protein [Vicinamibacterales bacterium]|nr:lysophospholipid acyltransferase family protein [Vicinamibacterales bacterium]
MSNDWRASALKRLQVRLIAAAGYPLLAALGHTLRWRVDGWQHFESILAAGRQPIMGFWHGRILPATLYFRGRGIVVITSENFDGEWIAQIIERFGYGTARGSTSRSARKAMLQLVRDVRQGRPAGFTLDGPRGPARVAQPGAVWLARATGNPLLPFHLEASSSWTLRSWDRTQIPRPFATVGLAIGEPLVVDPGASDAELEAARQDLERRLTRLEERAHNLVSSGARPRPREGG